MHFHDKQESKIFLVVIAISCDFCLCANAKKSLCFIGSHLKVVLLKVTH